jgi:hypothetical protein
MGSDVDLEVLRAWLSGRSLARRVPAPVPDFGGFRVDTNSDKEICRWVFATAGEELNELACSIRKPGYFLKLCGTAGELARALPRGWSVTGGHWFMSFEGEPAPQQSLPEGYHLRMFLNGPVTKVEIRTLAGELAASGYAAETEDAFVYDRIETDVRHRRKGLARAVMAALGSCRVAQSNRQLLTATAQGEKLYGAIGWRRLSPYSTACLPEI